MKKSEALANSTKARAIFNSMLTNISQAAIIGYTDGSVNSDAATCAYTLPNLSKEEAWHLTTGSNIQSAELQGIKKALEASYHHDSTPNELYIFSDSKAAILAINATTKIAQNPTLLDIWDLLLALKASGTQTHLARIPSHVGITGNEAADKLANNMDEIPIRNQIQNPLTPNEITALCKKKWSVETLNKLKLCGKPCVTSKTRLGITDWFHNLHRPINTTLDRLRTGHNRLNAFIHSWTGTHSVDMDALKWKMLNTY